MIFLVLTVQFWKGLIILIIKSKCKVAPLLIWTLAATLAHLLASQLNITARPTESTGPTQAWTLNLWLLYAGFFSKTCNLPRLLVLLQ